MAHLTMEELDTEIARCAAEIRELDAEFAGESFPEDARERWNELNEKHEGLVKQRKELLARQERLASLAGSERNVEPEREFRAAYAQKKSRVPEDPTDLAGYRQRAGSLDELNDAYREGALRIADRMKATPGIDREKSQERLSHIIDSVDDPNTREFAHRTIASSSPTYMRAWAKYIAGAHRTPEEERAMSLTSGNGGYAVPVVLDPSVVLVSAGQINPIRQVAKVATITGNTWQGITSTGITAAFAAEATEASDDSPTLVQPVAYVEKAQAFVPFSIEIGQDWAGMGAEMARLLGEAKDSLESTKFLKGTGHGDNLPEGLISPGGATAVVVSASTGVMAVGDLYNLEAALSPRFRRNAVFFGNKAAYQKIRQFDTQGGANLWEQLRYGDPGQLLGYPAYEWSDISSATTTSGSTVLVFGDPSYFQIVDRVGMDIEVIPHLFATANNRPTGQRGLYAYWRTTSVVTTPGLQANSAFVSLKLL